LGGKVWSRIMGHGRMMVCRNISLNIQTTIQRTPHVKKKNRKHNRELGAKEYIYNYVNNKHTDKIGTDEQKSKRYYLADRFF
jgi:hypothetical protein